MLFANIPGSRILVGLLILLIILLLVSWTGRQPPGKLKLYLSQAGIVIAIVGLLAMVSTGNLHWLFAVAGGLLPVAMRLMPLLMRAPGPQPAASTPRRPSRSRRRSASSSSRSRTRDAGSNGRSKAETRFLRVTLDQHSGNMRGKVLKGTFASAHLSELSLEQLRRLLDEYTRQDGESATLLAAYLEEMHGAAQDAPGAGAEDRAPDNRDERRNKRATGKGMTLEEAYEILGLQSGADSTAVTEAHRRLMQKLHPDRGGSNYLAAKINQAKDLLLAQ